MVMNQNKYYFIPNKNIESKNSMIINKKPNKYIV